MKHFKPLARQLIKKRRLFFKEILVSGAQGLINESLHY